MVTILKLEIKLNDTLIRSEGKYNPSSIQDTLDKAFGKYQFRKEVLPDGTFTYYGNGRPQDYATFGRLITTLKDKTWFLPYLEKWLWYNSDDGIDENDYTVEDVLYHYTKRECCVMPRKEAKKYKALYFDIRIKDLEKYYS